MKASMRRVVIHGLAPVVLVLAACSESDNDALAARDASAGGGSGGTGGSVAEAGTDSEPSEAGDALDNDAPPADSSFVPDGPSVFTFLHGIPDARALQICFEGQGPSGFSPTSEPPLPDRLEGLAYAHAFSASTIPGIDLAAQGVRPVVYTGALEQIQGSTCDDLDPLPPDVRKTPLPVIPAGTLARERSVLLVATGCVGPAPEAGPMADVCGAPLSNDKGNATLLVASMERTPVADAMGLQVFAASLAASEVTVEQLTAFPAMSTVIARNVAPGEIAPRPPEDDLSRGNLGTSEEDNSLRTFTNDATEPVAVVPLVEALDRGGLSLDVLEDGQNYTIVLVGPKPGLEGGDWFNGFEMTVVPSAP